MTLTEAFAGLQDPRTGPAQRHDLREMILMALRKFTLTLLRQDQHYPKRSLQSRRKTADRIPEYRASLLGLAPLG